MQFQERLFLLRHDIHLSKSMLPKTPKVRKKMTKVSYPSAIGSLMYAMLCVKPHIAYAASMTNKFQYNLGLEHWIAVNNILKYLRKTKNFLVYRGSELRLDVLSQIFNWTWMIECLSLALYSPVMEEWLVRKVPNNLHQQILK